MKYFEFCDIIKKKIFVSKKAQKHSSKGSFAFSKDGRRRYKMMGGGAWSMFVMHTIKDMKKDYNITMQYLSEMTKDHFDYVCEAIEEVVYHFQRMEMVKLIEDLYVKFYGDDKNTDFYHDNIEGLRNCIKKN